MYHSPNKQKHYPDENAITGLIVKKRKRKRKPVKRKESPVDTKYFIT